MNEHKYTDEEVIKALGCCYTNDSNDCYGCPYTAESTAEMFCDKKLTKDALDLINRQKAEISFWMDAAANAKKEAVKEFAEKIKNASYNYFDHLAEEFTEENK